MVLHIKKSQSAVLLVADKIVSSIFRRNCS